jgi:uncharacterized protein YbaR (Trm112 family)/SAM-dependent methyltransferase
MTSEPNHEFLVCPETKRSLSLCSVEEAERRMGASLVARRPSLNAKGQVARIWGRTSSVLLRDDQQCAYPVVDGIPVLLVPERLTGPERQQDFNLLDAKYAEAYEEMEFYDRVATEEASHIADSDLYRAAARIAELPEAERRRFPHPREVWLDAVYDCAAQWDAYLEIAPIEGKRVAQLGGRGLHAVKFLLAGAAEAWVVSPMVGEMRYAMALASAFGVEARLRCVVAVAEELPFATDSLDALYAGGCLHHMSEGLALPEAGRALGPDGVFAAVEPWRAPLYGIGTKLLGKRELGVYCRPLTPTRMQPLSTAFRSSRVVHHGALTRYLLLALSKFGLNSRLSVVWNLNVADDAICSVFPGLRGTGSSVAVLGRK